MSSFMTGFNQEKYKSMMEKVEKYAHLYDLPRKLEDAIVHFYTFQYRKKIGASETVRKMHYL